MGLKRWGLLGALMLVVISLASCTYQFSQVLFHEDFDDGNLFDQPHWAYDIHFDPLGEYEFGGYTYQGNYYYADITSSGPWDLVIDSPILELNGPRWDGAPIAPPFPQDAYYVIMAPNEPPIQPNYVSFRISSGGSRPGFSYGYFVLTGIGGVPTYITFHLDGDGYIWVNGQSYGQFEYIEWNEVVFTNINWDSSPQTFDLYVNDELRGSCIPFMAGTDGFKQLHLYNADYGISYYDDIVMKIDPTLDIEACSPPEPPPPQPAPPQVVPDEPTVTHTPTATATATTQPLTLELLSDAACRSGPLNDYPALTYLFAGDVVSAEGRDENGDWFYTFDGEQYCWLAGSVLEYQFDPQILQVVAAPPLPTKTFTPTSTDSACHRDMGQAACQAAGGIYHPATGGGAGAPTSAWCECP